MLNATYDFTADTAVLIDKALSAERKRWARDLVNKIFSELSLTCHEAHHGREVVARREIEYDSFNLPRVAAEALYSLEPPAGEGKRRCIIFIFNGEDNSTAAETVSTLREIMDRNGRWLGRTRIFAFSEGGELVSEIDNACYMGFWGFPGENINEGTAKEISEIIFHSSM